jgi:hypothetical protein
MPSRPIAALIVGFWAATLGVTFYQDLWPRIAASGPPPIAVDLSDEATQYLPIRWKVVRGDREIGRLTTKLAYQDADDTFEFTSQYKDLRIEVGLAQLLLPEVNMSTRVTRSGALRDQTLSGKLRLGDFRAEARVNGRVENGKFTGRVEIDSDVVKLKNDLKPVSVKDGQALNPLQPVNRIVGIRPGQRWLVQEINPLGDALAALFKEKFSLPEREKEPLLAEVGTAAESLLWGRVREEASCWVIRYRSGEVSAKTWVRRTDGKVLRQEAALAGDRIALEREE